MKEKVDSTLFYSCRIVLTEYRNDAGIRGNNNWDKIFNDICDMFVGVGIVAGLGGIVVLVVFCTVRFILVPYWLL